MQTLGATIQQRNVSHVVEADIRGFFDHVNHQWLMKFLSKRIRMKTRRIYIPGIHLLLWENPERLVQSKSPNQPQEDGPKPEKVYGMGEGIPDKTAKRRDAAPSKSPDKRASQSLCHNR